MKEQVNTYVLTQLLQFLGIKYLHEYAYTTENIWEEVQPIHRSGIRSASEGPGNSWQLFLKTKHHHHYKLQQQQQHQNSIISLAACVLY